MSNATVSRLGQNNLSGDAKALFYQLFTGEVLAAFDATNLMLARHRQRNIESGKSAGFANTGKAKGRYHTPGTEITGQNIAHGETVITIDDLLISDVFIANVDEAMNHYEVRGEYSHQLGEALGRTYDKQAFRAALMAARAANKITGLPGGTQITLPAGYAAATDLEKAQFLAAALFKAHQTMIEKDVKMDGVNVYLRPAEYFLLVQNKELLNKDWGGIGSYGDASLPKVAGLPLTMSNHVPNQNDASATVPGEDNGDVVATKYQGDFTKTKMVITTEQAIGTVNLLDLTIESAYDIRRQGTLFVAKKLCGTGVLRPDCATEIKLT